MKKVFIFLTIIISLFILTNKVFALDENECIEDGRCVGKVFGGYCTCTVDGEEITSNCGPMDEGSGDGFNFFPNNLNEDNEKYNSGIFEYLNTKESHESQGEEYSICKHYCYKMNGLGSYPTEQQPEDICTIRDMDENINVSPTACTYNITKEDCQDTSKYKNGIFVEDDYHEGGGCCQFNFVCWRTTKSDNSYEYIWNDYEPCKLSSNTGLQGCDIASDVEDKDTCEKKNLAAIPDYNDPEDPDPNLPIKKMTCGEILGPIGRAIVKGAFIAFQIIAAIIAIVNGLIIVVPAVAAHDADALKKSTKKLVILGVVLVIALIFKPLVKLLGTILGFDVSCVL